MTGTIRVALVDRVRQLRHTGVVKIRPEGTVVPAAGVAAVVSSQPSSPVGDGDTRTAIVRLLLEGPTTASSIGERLGLSAAGVRRHLDALIEAGDAQAKSAAAWQQEGRGRPAKRYQLTAAGRAKLEHAYDDLASAAMRALREVGGDDAVHAFARRRIDTILSGVAPAASDRAEDVESAAERVADALSRAGYATTTTQVRGPLGGVQICQHHCPVSHVAEEFPELCEAEQQAMSEVLGTHVQRLATIVNGDCACTTHVPAHSPRQNPSASKRSVSQ
ncbi:transcriptional regulator [Mycolicibacterium sp. 018/SC-01/001]|uniref:helix-turn-helix transcriptional regulator n=1 Tax=Mycolicibacterium sp. 018/SC-01/001 TaxID=2592069 RepID=UPI00117CCE80|nr:metalloregulator ArsR/SmtB family transcription factor [Mycolicibacterium sp. 018/SC-01/001]TRW83212.1 transcriptional regulator [Mycolicibacterium sp. 018/SC-01/001]